MTFAAAEVLIWRNGNNVKKPTWTQPSVTESSNTSSKVHCAQVSLCCSQMESVFCLCNDTLLLLSTAQLKDFDGKSGCLNRFTHNQALVNETSLGF